MTADVLALATTLSTSVLAAYFGTRFALGKHRSEKIWESKYAVYSQALKHADVYWMWATKAHEHFADQIRLDDGELPQLIQKRNESCVSLDSLYRTSGLLLSTEAMDALDVLLETVGAEFGWLDDAPVDVSPSERADRCHEIAGAVAVFIHRFTHAARRDLRLLPWWSFDWAFALFYKSPPWWKTEGKPLRYESMNRIGHK